MRLENLRQTHKVNIIATWLCTLALSLLSYLQNGLDREFFVTIGVMLSTSVLITILRAIPFSETAKGAVIVCCIGLATLLCSVLQGGSDRNFLASFFVLGLAMLYFDSRIILSYGAVYMAACVAAALLNPAYIDGADHVRARVLIKLVIYAGLTMLLFCATRKGEKMVKKSEEDAKILQQAAQDRQIMSQSLNVVVENSNAAMEELSSGADAIAAATHEMSLRFQGTLHLTEQLNDQMIHMAEGMEQGNQQMNAMMESFKEVHQQIDSGVENANHADKAMNQANSAVDVAANATQQLMEDIQLVQKQMGEIESIATQTNLISVNASIEAARAGQAGRSFSEVAKQVTMLAVHSAEVAQGINNTIHQLTNTSQKVFDCVHQGQSGVNTSRDHLTQMQQSMEQLGRMAQEMGGAVQQQQSALASSDQALNMMQEEMDRVAENARRNTAQVQEIATSIEEQSVSTREISAQLQEIATLSAQSVNL